MCTQSYNINPGGRGPYLIVGSQAIARALGVARSTLRRWIVKHYFPAALLNDRYVTTYGAIDQWIIARSVAAVDAAERKRNTATEDRTSDRISNRTSHPASHPASTLQVPDKYPTSGHDDGYTDHTESGGPATQAEPS